MGADGLRMVTKHLLSAFTDFLIRILELTLDSFSKDTLDGFIAISDCIEDSDVTCSLVLVSSGPDSLTMTQQ